MEEDIVAPKEANELAVVKKSPKKPAAASSATPRQKKELKPINTLIVRPDPPKYSGLLPKAAAKKLVGMSGGNRMQGKAQDTILEMLENLIVKKVLTSVTRLPQGKKILKAKLL